MTQDELWISKCNKVISFFETVKRNPSKNNPEERGAYLNWIKHNKKLYNAGEMKEGRIERFCLLLELIEMYKHVNQYQ